ncbi:MAG TPA: ABC transporter substrate-binding protein [Candidatus Binatia bacterium]|nr:ABC transporter substrate-binding protein [Candidatus Binatia bacterium]
MLRRFVWALAIAALAVIAGPVRATAQQKVLTVSVGYTSVAPSAISFTTHPVLGEMPEFFQKAGLTINPINAQMGQAVQMMMASNPPIVEGTGLGTVASGWIQGATDVKIFLAETQKSPYDLILRPGISKLSDVKTLGVPGMTSASAQTCQQLLRAANFKVNKDYRMVLLGTSGARVAAVQAGKVDGSCEAVPYPALYHEQYGLTVFPVGKGGAPFFAAGAWGYSTKWAAADPDHRETLIRIAEAVLMATRWAYDPANKEKLIAMVQRTFEVPRSAAELFYSAEIGQQILSPDCYMPRPSALGVMQAMVDIDEMKEIPKNLGQYFDWSILQTAAQRLKIKIRTPEY